MQIIPRTLASIILPSRYELAKRDAHRLAQAIPLDAAISPDEVCELSFDAGVETPHHGDCHMETQTDVKLRAAGMRAPYDPASKKVLDVLATL
jgi:hypothetical protein